MTKKLEELFDLADQKEDDGPTELDDTVELNLPEIQETLKAVDKIDAALPSVRDLEASDTEMDDIANTAKQTFQDLMDLGMNVEARFAGEIFNNASRMLDTALTAKSNKINKKLKIVELQLKKARHDQLERKETGLRGEDVEDGKGIVIDRNSLLNEILGKKD
jgi:hypothetical protein